MALAGSILGGFLGLIVGLPVPLLGPVLAAVLFAAAGAMAGAMLGEIQSGRDLPTSWRIAKLAFWGRLAGTAAKLLVGAVMIAVVVIALV